MRPLYRALLEKPRPTPNNPQARKLYRHAIKIERGYRKMHNTKNA